VFHRVDLADPEAVLDMWSSQTLFGVIQRLPHYRGVLRDLVFTAQDAQQNAQQARRSPVGVPPGTAAQAPVPLTPAQAGGGLPPALAQFVDR